MHTFHRLVKRLKHGHFTWPAAAPCCTRTLLPACSTLGIMMEEFTKSADIAADLLLSAEVDWARLFEPYPFFSLFKNFLQVIPHVGTECLMERSCTLKQVA